MKKKLIQRPLKSAVEDHFASVGKMVGTADHFVDANKMVACRRVGASKSIDAAS